MQRVKLTRLEKILSGVVIFGVVVVLAFFTWNVLTRQAHAVWYSSSWLYRKSITIHHGASGVTADQTNFPVLVNLSADTDLGAHARSDGFDVVFTSSDGTTKLSSEREKFVVTTGAAEMEEWVNVPTLSGSTDTVIYLYYGNASSCDQTLSSCDGTNNSTHVWDTNYKLVYHMSETSGGTVTDSSTVGGNGTKFSGGSTSTSFPAPTTSGQIDGADNFTSANTAWIRSSNSGFPTADFTFEFWVKPTTTASQFFFDSDDNIVIDLSSNKLRLFLDNPNVPDITQSTTLSSGNWYHVVATRSSGALTLYVNASSVGTDTDSNAITYGACAFFDIGSDTTDGCAGGATTTNGIMDEFRVSNIGRSSSWVTTEYNNESAPGTFYTLGSETANAPQNIVFTNTALSVIAGTCSALTVQLQTGGSGVNPTGTDTIQLSSNSSGGTFSSASDCSGATTTLSVSYNTSTNAQTVYYVDTKKGTPTLTGTQTGGPDTLSDGTQNETITAGTVTRLVMTLPGETFTDGVGNSGTVTGQTVGGSFTISQISATDNYFNVNTGYSGSKTLAYAGPANAPNGQAPSYTTSVSFTAGQSTTTLTTTLYKAQTTTITVTDGGSFGYASSSIVVSPGSVSAAQSTVSVSPSSVPINTNDLITLIANDTWQNPISGITGSNITLTGTTATYSLVRTPTTTDTNGQSLIYAMWSDIGSKTIVVVVSGTTVTQQPTITVTAAAAGALHFLGGTHIQGGSHSQ